MNRRLPAHADSNLDLLGHGEHDYDDPLHCPCLPPAEVIGRADDGEAIVRFVHDAVVSRVLRSEGGHP